MANTQNHSAPYVAGELVKSTVGRRSRRRSGEAAEQLGGEKAVIKAVTAEDERVTKVSPTPVKTEAQRVATENSVGAIMRAKRTATAGPRGGTVEEQSSTATKSLLELLMTAD